MGGPGGAAACDLHLHTDCSDGALSPVDLVRAARTAGLDSIAVTDHDTVAGVRAAEEEGRAAGIEVLAGIEVSADSPAGTCHVLGFLVDPGSSFLREPLAYLRAQRRRRVAEIVERLAAAGVRIDVPDRDPDRSVGRPHVARALVAAGRAGSIAEAFRRYLRPGAPGYVPSVRYAPHEAIGLIRRAGGVAVLAHPDSLGDPRRIEAYRAYGLDGVEAAYGGYDAATRARWTRWAAERGFLVTGGSDFHGDVRPEARLGAQTWPYAMVEALRRRARRGAAVS